MYKFAAASEHESIVYGSTRPGYRNEQVQQWIAFMQKQDIARVCCLLPEAQLRRYSNLLQVYQHTFKPNQVCWAPVEDFRLVDSKVLMKQILPFLAAANQNHQKVVVHCSGGVGRTGHVLAAWLVAGRGFSNQAALAAVKQTGRNPYEAVIAAPFSGRNPWAVLADLERLLDGCAP